MPLFDLTGKMQSCVRVVVVVYGYARWLLFLFMHTLQKLDTRLVVSGLWAYLRFSFSCFYSARYAFMRAGETLRAS